MGILAAIPKLFSDVFCDFNPTGHQFPSTLGVGVGKFSLHAEVMLLGRPSEGPGTPVTGQLWSHGVRLIGQ